MGLEMKGTVFLRDLKKMLEQYPDDMIVIHDHFSDYWDLTPPTVVEVIVKPEYYERFYPNQYPRGQEPKTIKCLCF